MDADAILKIVEDAFHHRRFIIDVIVSNNDSTMQTVFNNSTRGDRVQVLDSFKVKFDEEIPVPSFL